jgi:1-acyl-sn-glycerol-3-phosphate acyltransferase
VGLLPRIGLYRLAQALVWCGLFPIRRLGPGRVPRRGPVVLVFNHRTLFDPALLARATTRPIHFLTTAEAYRSGFLGWLVRHFVNVPLRRYRQDPVACRGMLRLLAEGEVIGMAVETERSVLGRYQGVPEDVAGIIARLGVPVVPVGISGSYDSGPRWAERARRRPIRLRVGPPVQFQAGSPRAAIDDAIRALVDDDPPPVHLSGLPRERLSRVVWRCPACGDEALWNAAGLSCGACGQRWEPTAEGWLQGRTGETVALAELGERVQRLVDEGELEFEAEVLREPSWFGPIRPLESLGRGKVLLDREAITFGALRIPAAEVTTVTTERADTLQVTTRTGMWQVKPEGVSVFRLAQMVEEGRAGRKGGREA